MNGTVSARMTTRGLRALRRDESGQDLLEYGLLAVIIGIAGILAFPSIVNKLSDGYADSNTAIQVDWEPCPPGGCAP
jgi:Flp pilus assembly pilin Flp